MGDRANAPSAEGGATLVPTSIFTLTLENTMRYRIITTPTGGKMVCPVAPIADCGNTPRQGNTYPSREEAAAVLAAQRVVIPSGPPK